ncbi:MAG: 6-phosphofructokinase [Armatimonadota bacterium]|nr:6-phosphofructokinase [Armatimonadota bacterium]
MAALRGKLVVGQSGGPTAVINASLAGVIQEAVQHEEITGIYGMRHGVEGLLREELIDLEAESAETVELLKHTPSAALGSCRHKLEEADYGRLLEILRAYDIRYFLYIGGNDSADTSHRLARLAQQEDYELRVIGIPKTVDNDLVGTDHCPGHPSVARWLAVSVRDAGLDTEAIGVVDTVKVIETMGRDTGWITAATALARTHEDAAPHLIYLPERPLRREQLLTDVEAVYRRLGHVVITVCEGQKDERGRYLAASTRAVDVDRFGHPQLGGAAAVLCDLIATELKLKARFDKPGTIQRVSAVLASPVDVEEAWRVGQAAVEQAVAGQTDQMVVLRRERDEPYRSGIGLVPLETVANRVRPVPDEFIAPAGNDVTEAYLRYIRPLIGGPLPAYARLRGKGVQRP